MGSLVQHTPTGVGVGAFQDYFDEKREFGHTSTLTLNDYLVLATQPRIACTRPTCTKRYDHGIIQYVVPFSTHFFATYSATYVDFRDEPEESWNFKPLATLNLR